MADPKENVLMEKLVSLCKRRGFIFQSSEIYGGINGFWDYGPLGTELKRNVKELWWNSMTRQRDDVVGLDATIIMAPAIWKASGHVDTFSDPMCDCLLTQKRFRADQIEPQSGVAYHYTGAKDKASASALEEPFAALIPSGTHPSYARQLATRFYSNRGLQNVELLGERSEAIENSTRFNPENGALLTEPRPFNLMLQTYVGPIQSAENIAYLRPETAQAIFAQFKNVHETARQKIPFGIAQIGKAFRNEVTPRNFTFRSREFEQMELEFFIKPDEAIEAISGSVNDATVSGHPGDPQPNWGWKMWHQYWVAERVRFYEGIGLSLDTLGFHVQTAEELAHYARATTDILFKFPFSKKDAAGNVAGDELEGIAARSDFDLSQHERFSGKSMGVFDEELRTAWGKLTAEKQIALSKRYYDARLNYLLKSGESADKAAKEAKDDAEGLAKGQYIPHVIEPSAGVDRLILALLANAFTEITETDEKGKTETRVVMKFHPRVAPIKVAVLPLLKNKPELVAKARAVFQVLRGEMLAFYDDGGSIGRRYARQDEAGTPFCVTIDFETLGEVPELKDTVTIRHRDDARQERLAISELPGWLLARVR
ncbi:MAG TPA: glycine--tRNA ligase [Verrucomicrobiota bacterium]|nr:glycine--tRNA ligase [Verrucomicrobiales bacterium]HRI13442.1 glycine--tRNA ligase [Verrucomicrobiota bacterium]